MAQDYQCQILLQPSQTNNKAGTLHQSKIINEFDSEFELQDVKYKTIQHVQRYIYDKDGRKIINPATVNTKVNAVNAITAPHHGTIINTNNHAIIETKNLPILGNAFIERDYMSGKSYHVKFNIEDYPNRLTSRIDKRALKSCIGEINLIFQEVNRTSPLFLLETSVLLITCFVPTRKKFRQTKYDKILQRLDILLDKQNNEVFLPLGLQILSPLRSGFRSLQICIYDINRFIVEEEETV